MKVRLGITAIAMVTLMAGVANGKEKEGASKRDQSALSWPVIQERQLEIAYRSEPKDRDGRLRVGAKNPDALAAIQNFLRSKKDQERTSKAVTFSFIRDTSLVVVPVTVNDHGPYKFLLDTGASNSILSAAVADSLRIRSGRPETLFSAGGNIAVTIRTIQTFQVGEARLKNTEIAVANFGLLQTLGIDGILGGDYLRRFKVSIDYEKQLVQIEPLPGSTSMLIA